MTQNEVKKLNEIADQEYRKALKKLNREHKARKTAIEWLAGLNGQVQSSISNGQSNPLAQAVNQIAPAMTGRFDRNAVEDRIRSSRTDLSDQITRPAMVKILKRLVDDGRLKIVQMGRGRRPTYYRATPDKEGE